MSGVLGLIGAMDEEIKLLLEEMENRQTAVKAGITFYAGTVFGKAAVVCKSGVGKVNAAVTTDSAGQLRRGAGAVQWCGRGAAS